MQVVVGSARVNLYEAKCKVAWDLGFAALKHYVQATSKLSCAWRTTLVGRGGGGVARERYT